MRGARKKIPNSKRSKRDVKMETQNINRLPNLTKENQETLIAKKLFSECKT